MLWQCHSSISSVMSILRHKHLQEHLTHSLSSSPSCLVGKRCRCIPESDASAPSAVPWAAGRQSQPVLCSLPSWCFPLTNSCFAGICLTSERLPQHMLETSAHKKFEWWSCLQSSCPHQAQWFLTWAHTHIPALWEIQFRLVDKKSSSRSSGQESRWLCTCDFFKWNHLANSLWLVHGWVSSKPQHASLLRQHLQPQGKNLLFWKWVLPTLTSIAVCAWREDVPTWL